MIIYVMPGTLWQQEGACYGHCHFERWVTVFASLHTAHCILAATALFVARDCFG